MTFSSLRLSVPSKTILSYGSAVSLLKYPSDYLGTLRSLIKGASSNITLSALYFGNKSNEMDLITDIDSALSDPMRPNLTVTFILDHSRASRMGSTSASSVQVLSSLVTKYHPRCRLLLYQMPHLRGRLGLLPTQMKETLGVYHCKFCVVDNTTILTGANLSEEYFENRQDRYMVVNEQYANDRLPIPPFLSDETLSSFLRGFVQILDGHCHHVLPGEVIIAPIKPDPTVLMKELETYSGHSGEIFQSFFYFLIGKIYTVNGLFLAYMHSHCKSHYHRHDTNPQISNEMASFHPLFQHGSLNINQEQEAFTQLFFSDLKDIKANILLATPYPSFSSKFMTSLAHFVGNKRTVHVNPLNHEDSDVQSLLGSPSDFPITIVVPSSRSHGFSKGQGIKSWIPTLHKSAMFAALDSFWNHFKFVNSQGHGLATEQTERMQSNFLSSQNILSVRTFARDSWTYHAKGMWLYDMMMNDQGESVRHVPMTYIGSSNLGSRSWKRDFELGFFLISDSRELQRRLGQECDHLIDSSEEYDYIHERKQESWIMRFLSYLTKSLL